MPSDDYASFGGGGALKLKGAKVDKKKRKKKDKTDLEKNLATGDASASQSLAESSKTRDTEKDKEGTEGHDSQNEEDERPSRKTETEKRHDELRRKRLLQMAEGSGSRPEILKTHKERVEELNTYLSKLSEHHDMPKIGPG